MEELREKIQVTSILLAILALSNHVREFTRAPPPYSLILMIVSVDQGASNDQDWLEESSTPSPFSFVQVWLELV